MARVNGSLLFKALEISAAGVDVVENEIRFSEEFRVSNVMLVTVGDERVKGRVGSGFEDVYREAACSVMSDSEKRTVRVLLEQIEEACSDVVAVERIISQVLEKCK